jgi:hypothetical protein
MSGKYYLHIAYDKKDDAKATDPLLRWCPDNKKWYTTDKKSPLLEEFQIIYLDVEFKDKDYVKTMGGYYDSIKKKWYCTPDKKDLIDKFT